MLQQWLVSSRRGCPLRSGKQIYLQFSNKSALCLTEFFSNQEFQLLCSLVHCSVLLFWEIYELFDALFPLRKGFKSGTLSNSVSAWHNSQ